MHDEFFLKTKKREEIIDITSKVQDIVKKSKIRDGVCVIYTPHATAAITIQENYDPNVCLDILDALKKIAPRGVWRHDKIDRNADSHIKSAILGPSQAIPIKNSKLQLGIWQSIGLCEFDGPRERKIIVKILK